MWTHSICGIYKYLQVFHSLSHVSCLCKQHLAWQFQHRTLYICNKPSLEALLISTVAYIRGTLYLDYVDVIFAIYMEHQVQGLWVWRWVVVAVRMRSGVVVCAFISETDDSAIKKVAYFFGVWDEFFSRSLTIKTTDTLHRSPFSSAGKRYAGPVSWRRMSRSPPMDRMWNKNWSLLKLWAHFHPQQEY